MIFRFDDICQPFIDSVIQEAKKLNEAPYTKQVIKAVIMVGHPTKDKRINMGLRNVLKLTKEEILDTLDRGSVVCRGAALYGLAQRCGIKVTFVNRTQQYIGVKIEDGSLHPLVAPDVSFPYYHTERFVTCQHLQQAATLQIYQGKCPEVATSNTLIGELRLDKLDQKPKGKSVIIVRLDIDIQGKMAITAHEEGNENNRVQSELDIQYIVEKDVMPLNRKRQRDDDDDDDDLV